MVKKLDIFIASALIIVLGFISYSNTLNSKFIMDDHVLIRDNPYIRNFSDMPKALEKNVASDDGREFKFYRPFQIFTYMLDYSLWKLDVRGYHLTNILIHIFSALAVCWLTSILSSNKLLSLLTGILFVVHPVHTEAVAYISGISDPLSTFFVLICFILYIKNIQSNNAGIYILMLISYVSALLSRENSLILPLLLSLYHHVFKKELRLKNFMSILAISFFYIAIRLTVLKHLSTHIVSSTTILQRLPGFFAATLDYIRLMLLPFNLHMEYGNKLFKLADPKVIIGIIIFSFLPVYLLIKRNKNGLIFFSIYWFFLALLPVSNIYPLNAYMAEHWLYLPSIGFFLILSYGIRRVYEIERYRILSILFIIGLVSSYYLLTIKQNKYWNSPTAFFERTLKYVPDSATAYNNLGIIYNDTGEKEKAVSFLKKAIELNPNNVKGYNNLGNIYGSIGKKEEAIALYKKAIEIDPDYLKAYYNLGNIYKSLGKNAEAISSYKKALEINPYYIDGYNNLGVVYRITGRIDEAIVTYKKAIEINPDYASAYNNLAAAYYYSQQYDSAIKYCDKAIELGHKVAPELLEWLEPYRKSGIK